MCQWNSNDYYYWNYINCLVCVFFVCLSSLSLFHASFAIDQRALRQHVNKESNYFYFHYKCPNPWTIKEKRMYFSTIYLQEFHPSCVEKSGICYILAPDLWCIPPRSIWERNRRPIRGYKKQKYRSSDGRLPYKWHLIPLSPKQNVIGFIVNSILMATKNLLIYFTLWSIWQYLGVLYSKLCKTKTMQREWKSAVTFQK